MTENKFILEKKTYKCVVTEVLLPKTRINFFKKIPETVLRCEEKVSSLRVYSSSIISTCISTLKKSNCLIITHRMCNISVVLFVYSIRLVFVLF